MQYEVWGRNVNTKRYEFISAFKEEKSKFSEMEKIDTNTYYEVMILKTDYNMEEELILYREYPQPKKRVKKKDDDYER